MLPDVWLVNPQIRQIWKTQFPAQPKIAFVALAESMFGGVDLNRTQVATLTNTLATASAWPTGKAGDGIDPMAPDDSFPPHWQDEAQISRPTPEWVIESIGTLLGIPNDVSVLDLGCGPGTLAAVLPPTAFYEGHDNNPLQIARARRAYPGYVFVQTDFVVFSNSEPDTGYGLVVADTRGLLNLPFSQVNCSELFYRATDPSGTNLFDLAALTVEVAIKSAVRGGVVAIVGDQAPPAYVVDWLHERGTVLLCLTIGDTYLLVFRNGIRNVNYVTDYRVFDNHDALSTWLAEQGTMMRVPVCADDPRPMIVRRWDITLSSNVHGQKRYGSCSTGRDVELYRGKRGVGIRWQDPFVALEWAQHQALTASSEESWDKTVNRFNQRFQTDVYLRVRGGDLNVVMNLPPAYTVREEPSLTTYLGRYSRGLERLQISYPEKTTLDNRYYTLGIGSALVKETEEGQDRYEVRFSEPDFSNSKPPKVHIEKVS